MAKKRRTSAKHPGLKKQYNSKVKQEYLDQDYIADLSEKEKDWLNDFNEEYYGANLDFKDLDQNRFHKTKKDKKACTDRNNSRNRCLYGIAKAGGKINDATEDVDSIAESSEDTLINLIDSKKSKQ